MEHRMKNLSKFVAIFLLGMFNNLYAKLPPKPVEPPPCRGNFIFQADLLYWTVHQEGLEVFQNTANRTGNRTSPSSTENIVTSEAHRTYHPIHFDWRPGFRIGAGYNFKNCQWTLLTTWTHIKGIGNGHGHLGPSKSSGHWNLYYNVLDIILTGPQFHLGSSFTWNAFGGIRAAQMTGHFRDNNTTFDTFIDGSSTTQTTEMSHGSSLAKYKGIGPTIGIKGSWSLPKRWSVYANLSGAFLYSYHKTKAFNHFTGTSLTSSPPDPITTEIYDSQENSKLSSHTCQPVIDVGVGFAWHQYRCLCDHPDGWVVKLGWEHSQWFDFSSIGPRGDLWLDGLTFSAQVHF